MKQKSSSIFSAGNSNHIKKFATNSDWNDISENDLNWGKTLAISSWNFNIFGKAEITFFCSCINGDDGFELMRTQNVKKRCFSTWKKKKRSPLECWSKFLLNACSTKCQTIESFCRKWHSNNNKSKNCT